MQTLVVVEGPLPHHDLCKLVHDAGAPYASRIIGTGDFSEALREAMDVDGFALVEVMELCTSYAPKFNPDFRLRELAQQAGHEPGVWRGEPRPAFRLTQREETTSVSLLDMDQVAVNYTSPLEGTLAVVTKIVLRLLPLPSEKVDLLVPYDEFEDAADTVSAIIAEGIVPTTIEFMERDSVLAVERLLGRETPHGDAAAQLLIQLDGNRREELDAALDVVGDLCLDHGARDVYVARDRPTRDRLWEARRVIIDALNHESPVNHMEDVVVPRANIAVLLKGIKEIAARHEVRIICFGHVGDGNVHVNVLKDDLSAERWEALVPVLSKEVYELTLSLKGMITGEHGIGATRSQYLSMAMSEAQIAVMRGIKAAFDPNQILNPGKIFL